MRVPTPLSSFLTRAGSFGLWGMVRIINVRDFAESPAWILNLLTSVKFGRVVHKQTVLKSPQICWCRSQEWTLWEERLQEGHWFPLPGRNMEHGGMSLWRRKGDERELQTLVKVKIHPAVSIMTLPNRFWLSHMSWASMTGIAGKWPSVKCSST